MLYILCPQKKDVCQVRLDFKVFSGFSSANNDGVCDRDRLQISNSITVPDGFTTCGNLADQHSKQGNDILINFVCISIHHFLQCTSPSDRPTRSTSCRECYPQMLDMKLSCRKFLAYRTELVRRIFIGHTYVHKHTSDLSFYSAQLLSSILQPEYRHCKIIRLADATTEQSAVRGLRRKSRAECRHHGNNLIHLKFKQIKPQRTKCSKRAKQVIPLKIM